MSEKTEPILEAAGTSPPTAAPTSETPEGSSAPSAPQEDAGGSELVDADDIAKLVEQALADVSSAAAPEPVQAVEQPPAEPQAEEIKGVPIDIPPPAPDEKPFSIDDLQSAIDDALKEAEVKKAAKAAEAKAATARASEAAKAAAAPVAPKVEPSIQLAAPAAAAPVPASTEPASAPVGAATPAEGTAAPESDDHFAAPETVLAQEEAAAVQPTVTAPSPMAVQELDAELAARGKAALAAEDEGSAIAPAATSVVAAAVAAAAAAAPAPAPSAVKAASEAPAPVPPPQQIAAEPKVGAFVKIKSLAGRGGQAIVARYLRLGAGPRKIITLSAWGTLLQAAVLWGWIMFIRSAELPQAQAAHADTAHPPAAKAASHDNKGAGHKEDTHKKAAPKKDSHGAAPKKDAHGAAPKKKASGGH